MAEVTWLESLTTLGFGPLLGAAVGFIGSGMIQRGTDKRTTEREREAREEERAQQRAAERRAFEISTFSRLPGLLQHNARSVAKLLLFDLSTLKEFGRMTSSTPSNDDDLALQVEFSLAISEVLDGDVRATLETASSELSRMQLPPSDWQAMSVEELKAERDYQLLHRLPTLVTETGEALNAYRRTLYQ
ncbi:hypothetical protein EDF31_107190 [Curtobacterium sp. PhB142]|uniref:hypothetical protein n=1 Tax=unclassified Curtobacterium TaxID=257496 RepID=UPI001046C228|nr:MULTISPECIES: hypothetical protein [unclassified Curtobacterium]TCL83496.1 hypothetical protein EDF31_107190 [Curtobacterium sp. PhB142]TCM01017.1 hypothetical protein EDF26_107190 [Curtobacterium sp. PhB134]